MGVLTYLFFLLSIDRYRQGRLVNWVEKAKLDRIHRLLEITEREHYHELLLSIKNLQDWGASPFPYIVHVLPRPLPNEVIKGEHFVLTNLLKSLPGGSTQVEPLIGPNCPPLAVRDPKPAPQMVTKKKKKSGHAKAIDEGLEGFVNWMNPVIS